MMPAPERREPDAEIPTSRRSGAVTKARLWLDGEGLDHPPNGGREVLPLRGYFAHP
uniref:Uncharacterized protein n=1 Tax=uncultured bacterium A1Q1_fos_479 TaxID=1256575 RepID=L7VXP6_9BACT|nr:hypothetical protein [uncultured bacterium A1Q1_fos_479]